MTLLRKIYRSLDLENGEVQNVLCHEELRIPFAFNSRIIDIDFPVLFRWISAAVSITAYLDYDDNVELAYVLNGFCRWKAIGSEIRLGEKAPETPSNSVRFTLMSTPNSVLEPVTGIDWEKEERNMYT